MRIATAQIQRQAISNILKQQSALYEQKSHLDSGKRINKPSDDPIGASQAILLRQQIASSEQFNSNVDMAQGNLEIEDSLLTSIINVFQRVRELNISSNNTSLNAENRSSIVSELKERLGEVLGLLNTKDANGDYIFSGYQIEKTPFTLNPNGSYQYNGDEGQRHLEISEGLKIPISDNGFDLFQNIKNGNGDYSIKDTAGTNTGTAVIGESIVTDPSAYVSDTYTLSFVTNSSGELAYQVIGASSGQVIPALPATVPNDAPQYNEGEEINFNGIQFSVSGTPNVGDDFEIAPSEGQSVLDTIQSLIKVLDTDVSSDAQKAAISKWSQSKLIRIRFSIKKH